MGEPIALTERQQQVVDMIRSDNNISLRALAGQMKINRSALDKHIEALKEKGVLKRIGGTRGHWQVQQ
jgi:ATP-dependent DNA helicase RecG